MLQRVTSVAAGLVIALAASLAQAAEGFQVWHEGRQITVVDHDGLAIFDGDIIMGRTADVLARSALQEPDGFSAGLLPKSVTIGTAGGRWPKGSSGMFELPYVIENDPNGNVPGAIDLFNSQLAGFMKAVPRTVEPDYVAFTLSSTDTSGACSSSVGRVGGRQIIQGTAACSGGTLEHEMGHAIGLWHEQQHSNWSSFLRLNLAVVDPSRMFNFLPTTNQRDTTPYDFASLMQYGSTSFSKNGDVAIETNPSGVAIGSRSGYSAADLEGIRRLYGSPPQQITVTTYPTGLQVIVDGVTITTPQVFSWAIGSTHTLDVPASAQVQTGNALLFARWNIDSGGDLNPRRTITVDAGVGSITAPTSAPAISTYQAAFVRYKQVTLATAGNKAGVGGNLTPSPAPVSLAGASGVYYREGQIFTLSATPNAGAYFGNWGGPYSYFVNLTTPWRNPFRGPTAISDTSAYKYTANFFDYPMITIRARAQDGDALGIAASVTPPGGTAADQRMPYTATSLVTWPAGGMGTITVPTAPQFPFSGSRYTFTDWDGVSTPTITAASPLATEGAKVVTANFNKEYQIYTQVIPSCAAGVVVPGGSASYVSHGSNLAVSLNVVSGWTFVGWEGSLSGNATSGNYVVTDVPNFTARLNTTNVALTVASVSPATLTPGTAGTLTIDGTGFTSASEVYLAGVRLTSTFVSGTRLTASVPVANIPAPGSAIVTVTNRVGSGSCSVSATGTTDVLGLATTGGTTPQTGWWWNPAESGRGFFIEQRGTNIFMAGYLYAADGRATWFSVSGPVNGSTFSAPITVYSGGQTLTGNYVAPAVGTSPGNVTLNFTSATTATLTWPGGTTSLQRFSFGGAGTSVPESGWWWNSAESGRGFSIETQGTAIFMAGFMYDAAGNPIWYAGQGAVASSAFVGVFQQYANGQTLTGPYQAPIVVNSNVGAITLLFTTSRTGTMTLPGGRQIAITRFDF